MSDKPREFKVKDHIIFVDAEDYPLLSRYSWSVHKNKNVFYAMTNIKVGGKNYSTSMHRLITGMSGSLVDHKNRNGLDNRKINLRFATAKQNSYNRVRKNKFGYRGVWRANGSKKFAIQIQVDGIKVTRYGFNTAKDAAKAYDTLNRELHGEFGIRNFEG